MKKDPKGSEGNFYELSPADALELVEIGNDSKKPIDSSANRLSKLTWKN